MKPKAVEKLQAVKLRKQGSSYSEIARTLNVAVSTLSRWLHTIPVVIEHRPVKPSEIFLTQGPRLHAERVKKTAETIESARKEIGPLSIRELKIIGAALYWAEGSKDKERETVAISNSDPQLVMLALRWLRVVCEVPNHKIKVQLHVHTDIDLEECIRFWMRTTRLSRKQFTKPYVKHSSLGHRKKLSYRGTVSVRVCDRQLYRRIQGWIYGLYNNHTRP